MGYQSNNNRNSKRAFTIGNGTTSNIAINTAYGSENRKPGRILHGDCIKIMRQMPANSVDFVLTDPPYLVNYLDRSGRSIQNDGNADWLKPAFAEAYRVLKPNSFMVKHLFAQESDALLKDLKGLEAELGKEALTLTVFQAYVTRLLKNARVQRYLERKHPEMLEVLQSRNSAAS